MRIHHPYLFRGLACAVLVAGVHSAQSNRPATTLERAAKQGVDTHFGEGLLGRGLAGFDAFRDRLRAEHGVDFWARYAPFYQTANGEETFSSDIDIVGRWDGLFATSWGKGSIDVYFKHRKDDVLGSDTAKFASDLGLRILTSDGSDGSVDSLSQLSWDQLLFADSVNVTFGQLDPTNLFDENEYGGNDRESFLAEPLSANPVRPGTSPGLGLGAWYHPSSRWYVGGAIIDADANGETPDFESASEGGWARHAEAALTPDVKDMGHGNYRLSFQSTDETDGGRESTSWSISIDQEMGQEHAIFARYAYGDGRRTRLDQLFSAGVVLTEAFGFDRDQLGIGMFWSSPSESGIREEWGMETFWRFQLTDRVDLTPDLFVVVPGDKSDPVRTVLSLRLGVNL